MKNQIYIFLAVLLLLISCKTDSPLVEPKDVFYWSPDRPQRFRRTNSTIDYKSAVLSPIKAKFESERLFNGSYNFNLILDGGDTLLFASDGNCFLHLKTNDVVSDSLFFSKEISFYQREKGKDICSPEDTVYIGFKKIYRGNRRTNFGWFRVTTPLSGYFQIDEMGWNIANHQSSIVGEKK